MRRSVAFVGMAFAVALSGAASPSFATPQPAPEGGPIEAFRGHDETSTRRVDHRLWASILEAAVDPNQPNRVVRLDYGKLGPAAHQALLSYLGTLQKTPISSLGRDEQLAYWLNFYNAASLSFVTDEFARLWRKRRFQDRGTSAKSNAGTLKLRVQKFYLGNESPWADARFTVEGKALSLNDIEHRILYPIWQEQLVTYGLGCPARGCPPIPDTPYLGQHVNTQLAEAAKWFKAHIDGDKFNWRLNGKAPRKNAPIGQTGRDIIAPTSQQP